MVDLLPPIQQLPHLRSHAIVLAMRIISQLFVVALSVSRIGAVLQAKLSAFEKVFGNGSRKALRIICAGF
jgi:hypothetical protein